MPKKSSGTRKVGSAGRSPSHQRYVSSKRWHLNSAKRILRHMKAHPSDYPRNAPPLTLEHLDKLLKKVDLGGLIQKSTARYERAHAKRAAIREYRYKKTWKLK